MKIENSFNRSRIFEIIIALFIIFLSGFITQSFISSSKIGKGPPPLSSDALPFLPSPPDSPHLYSVSTKDYRLSLGSKIQDSQMDPESLPQSQVSISSGSHSVTTSLVSRLSSKPVLAAANDSKEITIRLDPNSSVSYQAVPQGIKENITLQNRQAPNEFLFSLDAQNLEMRKNLLDQARWYFYDVKTQKPVFFLPHPFAVDAAGEKTYDLDIRKIYQNHRFYFKLILNQSWFKAPNRTFPVFVDPSINIAPTQTELLDKRTQFSKTFEVDNDTLVLQSSIGPVHYRDSLSGWQDLDVNLTPGTDPDFTYAVLRADIKSQFHQKVTNHPFLKLQNAKSIMEVGLQNNLPFSSDKSPVLDNNTITYPQILPGISLRYTINSDQLLEEYVVDNPSAAFEALKIIQDIKVPDSTYQKEDDRAIRIFRSHSRDLLWYIPPPKMYDRNSESTDIDLAIIRNDDNSLSLQKSVTDRGRDWLNSPDRVYPLVVDAAVTRIIESVSDTACSNSVSVGSTDNVSGGGTGTHYHFTIIGHAYAWGTETQTGFRFSNLQIAQSATITSAIMSWRTYNNVSPTCSINIYAEATDNSSAFVGSSWPHTRTTTSTSVGWTLPNSGWDWKDTPNLASPLQNVIGRSGWSPGNAATFIIKNNSGNKCDNADVDVMYPMTYATDRDEKVSLTVIYKKPNAKLQLNNTKVNNTKIITD